MISYKLAKQLKEAGFPFKSHLESVYVMDGKTDVSPTEIRLKALLVEGVEVLKIPTLEELIDWCGGGFGELGHWKGGNEAGDWQVISGIGQGMHNVWGKTPSMAVAKLGLKLHSDAKHEYTQSVKRELNQLHD